jgi:hypothetical protein
MDALSACSVACEPRASSQLRLISGVEPGTLAELVTLLHYISCLIICSYIIEEGMKEEAMRGAGREPSCSGSVDATSSGECCVVHGQRAA